MAPVLGVEGGGSHCHSVVVEESGALLGVGANDDPANWEDVGIEAAAGAIRSCIREALSAAGMAAEAVQASVLALAGIDFPMDEQRLSGIPAAIGLGGQSRIANDAFAALRAGTDEPFGVVAVAGTGAIVAGRNPAGEEFRTLGMGPMFGDSGSASEVSDAAVTAVAAAFTGRGPETVLTAILCERTGFASVVDFLEAASRGRVDPSSFGREVVAAAEEGDAVACGILTASGRALGETAAHVIRRLGLQDEPFDLVLAGGMFRSKSPCFTDGLDEAVRPVAADLRLRPLQRPPVVGSALLAIELLGGTPAPGTRVALADEVASSLGLDGPVTTA